MSPNSAWIVVAEDNKHDLFLMREALTEAGLSYRLDAIPDGDQMLVFIDGLEADFETPCPDLFVLDVNLPKRSGRDILSRLRGSVRCAGIPIIVMSSSDAPDDQEAARTQGALYFRKLADLNEFLKIGGFIRSVLEDGRPGAAV